VRGNVILRKTMGPIGGGGGGSKSRAFQKEEHVPDTEVAQTVGAERAQWLSFQGLVGWAPVGEAGGWVWISWWAGGCRRRERGGGGGGGVLVVAVGCN